MTRCTNACRTATGPDCRCSCEGERHGAEAATQQLTLAALSPTVPVTAPEPVEAPRKPPEPVAPAPAARNGHRAAEDPWERGHCVGGCGVDGKGRPFSDPDVDVAAMLDDGSWCHDCYTRLLAEQAAAERVERPARPPRPKTKGRAPARRAS